MANEKIKCKSCRKSFDPDLYSGLCPKCGTYNGQRMNSSALEHYISGGDQGESQHRELHEKYDKSYQAAHPDHNEKAVLLQEAREAFAKRQNARQETLINGRPVRKSALPKFFITLVITVIIAIAVIVISVIYNNIVLIGKTEAHEVQLLPETNPGTVIFDHELLDGPIIVTALSAGMVEDIEGLSGKSIYAVTVSGGSEEYNFDAKLRDVFLQYEYQGNCYYEMPLDSYSMEEFCKKYNIWEEEVLSGYSLGSSSYETGYLFFLIDTEAEDFQLLLQLSQYEDPAIVLQEAYIDLGVLPAVELKEREAQ